MMSMPIFGVVETYGKVSADAPLPRYGARIPQHADFASRLRWRAVVKFPGRGRGTGAGQSSQGATVGTAGGPGSNRVDRVSSGNMKAA